jgi:hypothetical protein
MKVNVIALCLVDTALHCGTGRAFMNNSSGFGIERYKVKCLKRALDGELLGIYRRRTERKSAQISIALCSRRAPRSKNRTRRSHLPRWCGAKGLLPTKPLVEAFSAQTG